MWYNSHAKKNACQIRGLAPGSLTNTWSKEKNEKKD